MNSYWRAISCCHALVRLIICSQEVAYCFPEGLVEPWRRGQRHNGITEFILPWRDLRRALCFVVWEMVSCSIGRVVE